MKKYRPMLYILFANMLLLCCSCGFFGDQSYVCNIDAVESAQIIRLDKYVEGEYRYEYTVLSDIMDVSTFVDQVNHLEHSVNWGEPGQFNVGYVVIRINYSNGDFDLLYPNAQWLNRSGVNQDGFFFFNREQFDALISDYWTALER